MVSRTREKLIEVARQLFARKGVDNTTMSDIATASDKGRRTIYTYFKSKREIYEAAIEQESEQMVQKLRDTVNRATTAESKLRAFLRYRLDLFEMPIAPRGMSLDSILNLDFNRIDKVRHIAMTKEKELLHEILADGVAGGSFIGHQAERVWPVLQLILQGVDLSRVNDTFKMLDIAPETYKDNVIEFIINSLIINKSISQ